MAEVIQVTVGETVADFLADCEARNLSPRTIVWYEQRLGILRPCLDAEPDGVSDACLEGLLRPRRATIAPSTFNGYIRALRAWLYWCQDEGIPVPARPRRLRSLRMERRLPPNLTAEQVARLLAAPDRRSFIGQRDLTMMMLMLDVGTRLKETISIKVEDLELPHIRIMVAKMGKQRVVSVSDPMHRQLCKYLRARASVVGKSWNPSEYLLPSRQGRYLSHGRVHRIITRYARMAGLDGVRVSAHVLRYTYATVCIRSGGMSLAHLQSCLGHSTLAMTRHYVCMDDHDAHEASRSASPIAQMAQRRASGSRRRAARPTGP
jgi:integrase/recombinase XerD